jgi:alkyl hydroperoxide reductase subunit AhpC
LAEYKKHFGVIKQFNTRVFAISVDRPETSAGFRKKMQLPFELLCDPDKEVVKRFHLLNLHEHNGIAYPATFVINPQGRIVYRSLDGTFSRVQIAGVLQFLEKLQKKPSYKEDRGEQKSFIIPSLTETWQVTQNMIFRGSTADWKHYFMFVFVYFPKNIVKSIIGQFR